MPSALSMNRSSSTWTTSVGEAVAQDEEAIVEGAHTSGIAPPTAIRRWAARSRPSHHDAPDTAENSAYVSATIDGGELAAENA